MKILKVLVHSTIDYTKSGKFSALLPPDYKFPEDSIDVIYTSPAYSTYEGGVFAPPSEGSEILVAQQDNTSTYYYISTIVNEPKLLGVLSIPKVTTKVKDLVNSIAGKQIYTDKGSPRAIYFTDFKGAGLKISNYFSKAGDPINSKVQLRSVQGHKLVLSDNPDLDCVLLRNKDGDGMTITANRNSVHSSNSIDIKSKNTIRQTTDSGELRYTVLDGRDITIENQSTGVNADPLGPYGNVNLVASWKDINIYTQGISNPVAGDAGRILISTPEGVIQLRSGVNGITLYTAGNINIAAPTGDVNIQAGGSINLDAGLSVNIKSGVQSSLTSLGKAVVAGGAGSDVGITGTPLNLNTAGAVTPPVIETVPVLGKYLN
jgi:hypothetical protein